ncbi:LiaF domain-containing protein [Halobium salinum]|uniref:LiaF domain-containing protein n=1 Tax=Halobium salinum TaxID=1364940 RepID=A0ABD5PGF9_9EURY|nr:LiaF domain-containing protein [Halobium salinum]
MAYRRISNQTLLGGVVALVGLVLLANTTGLYDTGALLRYVPSLFVLVGLYAIVASGFRNVAGPLVVVALAGASQLIALDLVAAEELVVLWPVVVVAFGAALVAGRVRSRVRDVDADRVDLVAVFGGRNDRVTSSSFVGGDVTAMFGGAELDLRDATVPVKPARVNATALFGGVEVVVPRDWRVEVDVLPVFGAAEDDRPRRAEEHEEVDLVVTGFCAFGAVEVTD